MRQIYATNGLFSIFIIFILNLNLIFCNDIGSISSTTAITASEPIIIKQPQNQTVNVKSTVTLECRVDGLPKPAIKWFKDDVELDVSEVFNTNTNELKINQDTKYVLLFDTDLFIVSADGSDMGVYYCIAENDYGRVQSDNATVSIAKRRRSPNEKPVFTREPQDVKAQLNTKTELVCDAKGSPEPTIEWKRVGTNESFRKGKTLVIENVQVEDEGEYVCQASNSLASIQARAKLTVYEKPVFVRTLSNVTYGFESKSITIECNARGRPQPTIYWAKSGNLESASKQAQNPNEEFLILENGNLFIERLNRNYDGTYLCQATNEYGSVEMKTYLQVKQILTKPPPIIEYGPQNQTIPINTQAMLECKVLSSDSKVTIVWFKGNQQLTQHQFDSRKYYLEEAGSLVINLVQKTDSDRYRCVATNAYGQTASHYALLKIEDPNDPYIEFQRNYPIPTLPAAPHQPTFLTITSNSVQISWQPSMLTGHSQLVSYRIEYFSPEWSRNTFGWTVLVDDIDANKNFYTIGNLQPDTYYMFIVRARNEYGYGAPSQSSDLVKTLFEIQSQSKDKNSKEFIEKQLTGGEIVQLQDADVLTSTSINITWNVLRAANLLDGFYLKYKQIGEEEYRTENVNESKQRSFILKDLLKFTTYEIFIEPYSGSIRGVESNRLQVKTREDVPDQSPSNIIVQVESTTTMSIKWQPPSYANLNGIILGYKIHCIANETKFNIFLNTNATTRGIILGNLIEGMRYCVKVAAYTKVGSGPFTQPIKCVDMSEVSVMAQPSRDRSYSEKLRDFVFEPWFIAMGAVIFAITLFMLLYCFWLVYRRVNHKSKFNSNNVVLEVHKNDNGNRYKLVNDNGLWMDTLHSSNNSNQECCCVPDLSHQLFLQKKSPSNALQDLNSSLEQRLQNSLLKQTQNTSTYNSSKTSELTCLSNNQKHHSQPHQQVSSPSTPSSSSPQYAEIYSSNQYASMGLFPSTDNSNADLINSNFSYIIQHANTNRRSNRSNTAHKAMSPIVLKYDNVAHNEIHSITEKDLLKYIQAQTQSQTNTPRVPIRQQQQQQQHHSQRIQSLENKKRREHRSSSLLSNQDQIRMQLNENKQAVNSCLQTPPPPPRQPPPSLDTYINNTNPILHSPTVHYNQPWNINAFKPQQQLPTTSTMSRLNNYQIQPLTSEQQILLLNQQFYNQQFLNSQSQPQQQLSYVYQLVPVPTSDIDPLLRNNSLRHQNIHLVQPWSSTTHEQTQVDNSSLENVTENTTNTNCSSIDDGASSDGPIEYIEEKNEQKFIKKANSFLLNSNSNDSNQLYITESNN